MKLTHLRSFVAAATEGSFHRAAAQLNIAQPALSRQIRDLEEEVEAPLFARSAQGVVLLPAGEALLEEAKRLLEQVEFAKTRARRAAAGQFGLLRVAFTMIAAEVPGAMQAFAQAQRELPDIDWRMRLINSDRQAEALASGEIDVGLLYRRDPTPPDMAYHDLRVDRYMLLVKSDHPLTKKPTVRLADLQGENMTFASLSLRPETYRELIGICLRGGLTPRIAAEFETFESEAVMINLAAQGIAVSFANSSLRERGRTEGVTFLPIADLDMPLRFAAMWRKAKETPALLRFVDLLTEHVTDEGGKG
jgi:DNA-binding transcriptional LysR family regulator